jgi:hypothetical protein
MAFCEVSGIIFGGVVFSRLSRTSKSLKILQEDELHPYHDSRRTNLFPDSRTLWMQFFQCLQYQNTNVHNSLLCPQDNPHAIRAHEYQVSVSISIWNWIVGDISCPLNLLPERPTTQQYHDSLVTVLLELPEDVPSAMRQRLWFEHDGAPVHSLQWLNTIYPGRCIWRCGSVALSPW